MSYKVEWEGEARDRADNLEHIDFTIPVHIFIIKDTLYYIYPII